MKRGSCPAETKLSPLAHLYFTRSTRFSSVKKTVNYLLEKTVPRRDTS